MAVKDKEQSRKGPNGGGPKRNLSGSIPFLDLFAGAGGLSIGLVEAGFEPVGAIEIMDNAAKSYEEWHGLDVDRRRLEDLPAGELRKWRGEVGLVAGGPPCQPWSTGGLRLAELDDRDGFPAMVRALRIIEPEAFIIENVAGIERGRTRPYFQALIRSLGDQGYKVHHKTLNAADFGVPQHRRRMFIVGSRSSGFQFPSPSHGPETEFPWVSAGTCVRNVPFGVPNPSIVTYAKRPHLRPSPYDGLLFNGGGRPIDPSQPARTILASAGGNKTQFVDTEDVAPEYHAELWDKSAGKPRPGYLKSVRSGTVVGARRITVEESARLQSFPEDMFFHGPRSAQYTLVGNAVPPRLAAAVGRTVRSLIVSARP
jgi:DNA (cytosine-5)-methyltransferase 1